MSSVALYGFATHSREGIHATKANEIWSIAWAYKYNVPRLDLILEIHPIWLQARSIKPEYQKPRDHWAWLQKNKDIRIVMTEPRPEVPRAERYPLELAQRLVPPARRRKVFSSSFDYLMALAILSRFDRIEVYGFEMGSDTEYRYQREGAAYWIAQCDARGIELVLPENTRLLSSKLYGFEGGSMIYRQDLERLKNERLRQKTEAFSRLSNLEGQLKVATDKGDGPLQAEIAQKWDKQFRIALVTAGALQECEYLLKEIDLEEPDDTLEDPIGTIPLEA